VRHAEIGDHEIRDIVPGPIQGFPGIAESPDFRILFQRGRQPGQNPKVGASVINDGDDGHDPAFPEAVR
jgi:hypothetical protein